MADGVNIDFGALKQPDYVGDYVNAFQVGQQLARQSAQQNALERVTPAALGPAGRAAAARQIDLFSAIGLGLRDMPYAARGPVLAHMAPALARRGIEPQAIRDFDPTDANLEQQLAGLAAARRVLAGWGENAFAPRSIVSLGPTQPRGDDPAESGGDQGDDQHS